MSDPKQAERTQKTQSVLLSESVHYVSRTSVLNANLVEQAGIVISQGDLKNRFVVTVFQPGEAAREVTATYSEIPADNTFHLRLTRHAQLGQRVKRFMF